MVGRHRLAHGAMKALMCVESTASQRAVDQRTHLFAGPGQRARLVDRDQRAVSQQRRARDGHVTDRVSTGPVHDAVVDARARPEGSGPLEIEHDHVALLPDLEAAEHLGLAEVEIQSGDEVEIQSGRRVDPFAENHAGMMSRERTANASVRELGCTPMPAFVQMGPTLGPRPVSNQRLRTSARPPPASQVVSTDYRP